MGKLTKHIKTNQGFSYIEVMVSLVIVALILIAAQSVMTNELKGFSWLRSQVLASILADNLSGELSVDSLLNSEVEKTGMVTILRQTYFYKWQRKSSQNPVLDKITIDLRGNIKIRNTDKPFRYSMTTWVGANENNKSIP